MAKHLQESKLNNKSYDILKWVALVALPATSALYLTLAALRLRALSLRSTPSWVCFSV